MRKALLLIALLVMAVVAHAQRIQVVDIDGLPIAAVCVTNENGALVGSTDSEGWLNDTKGVKHLFCFIQGEGGKLYLGCSSSIEPAIIINKVIFNP